MWSPVKYWFEATTFSKSVAAFSKMRKTSASSTGLLEAFLRPRGLTMLSCRGKAEYELPG